MAAEYVIRLGEGIRRKRKEAGLTQNELADRIPGKTDGSQVSKWERGQHQPGADTLEHIATALSCTVADFYAEPPALPAADLMGALKGGQGQLDQIAAMTANIAEAVALLLQAQTGGLGAEEEFERELESAALLARLRGENTAATAHKPHRRGKAHPAPPDSP